MTPQGIEAEITRELNAAEAEIASVAARLTRIEQLSTPEFEANFDAKKVDIATRRFGKLFRTIGKAKSDFASFHAALANIAATANYPRPRFGK